MVSHPVLAIAARACNAPRIAPAGRIGEVKENRPTREGDGLGEARVFPRPSASGVLASGELWRGPPEKGRPAGALSLSFAHAGTQIFADLIEETCRREPLLVGAD
jgi:hypothetical protein